jgi:hypothetical protein
VKALLLGALAFALLCAEGLDTWRAGKLAGAAGARLAVVATAIAAGALGAVAWLHQNGLQYLSPSPLAAASPGPVVALAALSAGLGLAAAGLAALSVRGNGARWGAAVAVVATLDLFAVHHDLNKVVPGATVRRTPEVVEVLRADGASRVHTFDYLRRPAGTPPLISEERPELARLPTSRRLIALAQQYVVIAPLWGFRGSFETDVVGLDSRQRRGLQLLAVAVQRDPWQFLRLLQTCGVTHVVARHSEGLELLEPLRVVHTPSAGEVHVFRVPGTLPRALVVPEARTADGLRAYQVLFEPTFDPRSTILLPSTERAGPAGPSAPWRIDIREERADRLGLTVTTARPGFLVVVDGYDKGWEAALDGQPVPVLRANVAFRGVAVPAGTHDVRLRYRPPRLGLGLTVSALSLAALLGLLWFGRGRAGDVP